MDELNPPAILDPVIMTLSNLYQRPVSLDPLEAGVDKVGVESDHRIVICKPINIIENQCSRSVKVIKFRPLSESGYKKMQEWLLDFDWKEVYEAETADNKAEKFQKILVQKVDTFFPIKTRKVCNDDQPWFTFKLKKLDRQRKRVYRRERRSIRWKNLDSLFKQEMKSAKSQFYKKEVAHLKLQNPGKWYQCLKKLSSHDQHLQTEPIVDEISHLPAQTQAELIAEQFSSIPNEYNALKKEDIRIPPYSTDEVPQFLPAQVWFALSRIHTNKATVDGDIPAAIIKKFAAYFCEPLTHMLNNCMSTGVYPKIYKFETCTPVPKVYPTKR